MVHNVQHAYRKVALLAFIMALVFGVALYLSSQQRAAAGGETAVVSISDFAFSPQTLDVEVGTTVTWTNEDGAPHTVTGDEFDSGNLNMDESFSVAFDEAGSFSYICTIHDSMSGLINVGQGSGDDALYLPTVFSSNPTAPPPIIGDPVQTVRSGHWSDATIWQNGRLPQVGDRVQIFSAHTVTLDVQTPALSSLLINGELIFADQAVGLAAGWIMVHGTNALLQVGTEAEPFQSEATITLLGSNEEENVMGESPLTSGTKFLMVMEGGRLELHGSSREKVSWTQLDDHANVGRMTITLAEPVNWESGDQIVIAPSGFDPFEAEQVTVTAVNGNQVSFSPALQHDHWGTIQTYEGRQVDQRAEVGLLTRNIRIQGGEDSVTSNFGGHTMIMPNASARVEGVEFYRMGQMGHAARYPLHWHLLTRLGDGSVPTEGQYAKNNSIHASFHRGIVIHGTNDILVERNVAYDIWSHTFVPAEDGDEYNNRFIQNLGILTKKLEFEDTAFPMAGDNTERTTQSEHRPGTFWLRNPFNEMIGNHAGGSYRGMGFFYDHRFIGHQIKQIISHDPSAIIFRDNVAHSNFQPGGGNDRYPPNTRGYGLFVGGMGTEYQRLFTSFTAYKNYGGIWIEELSHQIDNAIVADNAVGIIVFRGQVANTLHIGETENGIDRDGKPRVGTDRLGGGIHVMRQQGGAKDPRIRNMTFVNELDAAYVYLDTRAPESENYISGSQLVNVQRPFIFYKTPEGYIVDADGSLTGIGTPVHIYSENLGAADDCTHEPDWQAYVCPAP